VTGASAAFPWEAAIADRARHAGLSLPGEAVRALAAHARAVLDANARLHLTAITEPDEFVERHVGESLEGAALIPETLRGTLLDLGSGNGYPGIPIAIARPSLQPVLVESSAKKSSFLRDALIAAGRPDGVVLTRHVTRASDIEEIEAIAVLATRAMGDWERIVPRLASRLASGGIVLAWTTTASDAVFARTAWKRLRRSRTMPLTGRERSVLTVLERVDII